MFTSKRSICFMLLTTCLASYAWAEDTPTFTIPVRAPQPSWQPVSVLSRSPMVSRVSFQEADSVVPDPSSDAGHVPQQASVAGGAQQPATADYSPTEYVGGDCTGCQSNGCSGCTACSSGGCYVGHSTCGGGHGDCGLATECFDCYQCPRAVWRGYAGLLVMDRSSSKNSNPLVACDCVNGPSFAASDARLGWAPGVRLSLYRHRPCKKDFEITYFGLYNSHENRTFEGPLRVLGQPRGTTWANFDYASTLNSLEFNLRHDHGCNTQFLCGLRWFNVDESSHLYFDDLVGGCNCRLRTNTQNDLMGLQLGVDHVLWDNCGCLKVHFIGRGGAYYAHSQIERLCETCNQVLTDHENKVAFAGDAMIQGRYHLTPHIWLNAGYQFLWIDGLALAADQYYGAGNSGNAFYHGLNLGAEIIW